MRKLFGLKTVQDPENDETWYEVDDEDDQNGLFDILKFHEMEILEIGRVMAQTLEAQKKTGVPITISQFILSMKLEYPAGEQWQAREDNEWNVDIIFRVDGTPHMIYDQDSSRPGQEVRYFFKPMDFKATALKRGGNECEECDGFGRIVRSAREPKDREDFTEETCAKCKGTGIDQEVAS